MPTDEIKMLGFVHMTRSEAITAAAVAGNNTFITSSRTSTVMQSAQHGQIIALKSVYDLVHI